MQVTLSEPKIESPSMSIPEIWQRSGDGRGLERRDAFFQNPSWPAVAVEMQLLHLVFYPLILLRTSQDILQLGDD